MKNRLRLLPLIIALLSVSFVSLEAQIDFDVPNLEKTQIIAMDLIVQGSECVGFDCVNGENFGSDTERLKENNLRIHFDDTSNSASFPANDWRIVINDTENGGASYFLIQDATGNKNPFRIEAGAPNDALYVEDSGDIGIGTNQPVVEVHVADGDTPTLRLEQNQSAGFAAQTWDIAGNETNFFIRDVTNGSELAFKIKPGADENALFVDADNDIGFGTQTPNAALDIIRSNLAETAIEVQNNNATTQDVTLRMGNTNQTWIAQARKNGGFRIRNETSGSNSLKIAFNNNVDTEGDITANGVLLTSDERLKTEIQPFNEGLSIVNRLNPISYKFNEKSGFLSERTYYSIRAQELQEVAPYLVHDFVLEREDKDGKITSADEYLKIDIAAMPWVLVNAVKEQQTQLDEKENQIQELSNEVSELKSMVKELISRLAVNQDNLSGEADHEEFVILTLGEIPYMKQNVPNPYSFETTVDYYIPESTNSAEVQFYDSQGRLISTHTLNQRGHGKLNLKAEQLPAGTYIYSLVIDGKVVNSRKMAIE